MMIERGEENSTLSVLHALILKCVKRSIITIPKYIQLAVSDESDVSFGK